MGAVFSLLPNKVSAREVRPPPVGPRRISLRPGWLALSDSSGGFPDDPAQVTGFL